MSAVTRQLVLCLAVLAAWGASAPRAAAGAAGGDKPKPVAAPHLLDKVEWLKGRGHKRFQRGNVYVLDFWLPWQGYSRDALPSLCALRKKFAQERVVFISVATAPLGAAITPQIFLERRGDAFDDIVARDVNYTTYQSFSDIGALDSLPGVVIVDRTGNIAWYGSPFEDVEAGLVATLADDTATSLGLVRKRKAEVRAMKETIESFDRAYRHKLWTTALTEIDKLIAAPGQHDFIAPRLRYQVLAYLGKKPEAAAYGRTLVDSVYADMEYELDMIAWFIATAKLPEGGRDLDLALAAAEKARALSYGKDWSILDTLARVHARRGELDQAIAVQTESMAQAISGEEREVARKVLEAYQEKREPPPAERDEN